MTEEERELHTNLGDGVYVQWDGEHMILRTGDHRDGHCDNKIYLEPSIVSAFQKFTDRIFKKVEPNE